MECKTCDSVGISVTGDISYLYSKSNNLESVLQYWICMRVKLLWSSWSEWWSIGAVKDLAVPCFLVHTLFLPRWQLVWWTIFFSWILRTTTMGQPDPPRIQTPVLLTVRPLITVPTLKFKSMHSKIFNSVIFWMTTNANCWLSHQQATLTDSAASGGIWLVCFECGKKVFICTVKYWKGRHTQLYWHYWCYWDYLQFLCFIINQRFINCITYSNIPGNLLNDQLNGTLYFLFLSIVHLWCWVDLVDDRVESWLLDWAHLIRSSLPVTTPVRQTTPWL